MSHGQQYQARLQANVQASSARIIQLEATVAQKSDQLAHREGHITNLNAQIQRLMASSATGNDRQAITTAMQTQINQATTRAMTAENSLKQNLHKLNSEHQRWVQHDKKQNMEIQHLQRQIQTIQRENMVLRSSIGVTHQVNMDTMMKNYRVSEMQTEVRRKQGSPGLNSLATAKRKAVLEGVDNDDDEDDEEPMPTYVKQEPVEFISHGQVAAISQDTRSCTHSKQTAHQNTVSDEISSAAGPHIAHRPSLTQRREWFADRAESTDSGPSVVAAIPPSNGTSHTQERGAPAPSPPPKRTSQYSSLSDNRRSRPNAVDLSAMETTAKPIKRPRGSYQEQIKNELQDLEITDPVSKASLQIKDQQARTRQGSKRSSKPEIVNLCDTPSPDPPTKRRRTDNENVYLSSSPQSHNSTRGGDIRDKMRFKAMQSYGDGPNASEEYLDSDEDLADVVQDLWEQIESLFNLWEEAKGEDWKYEFEVKLKDQDAKPCVSSRLKIEGRESGRSKWRSGCEGRYACSQCVKEGKPCFVWYENEFRLLPLHDEDRVWPVEEHLEVRLWINIE